MRTRHNYLFGATYLVFAILFIGCDIVEGPYIEGAQTGSDTSTVYTRKVLVEDFTGHTCGNCPRAAETAHTLEQLYGEQIVVVGVHIGWFAKPVNSPPNPDSSYIYDFRTTAGTEIDVQYGIDVAGLPRGMVNRIEVSGSPILGYSAWGTAVAGIVDLPPDLKIEISNSYNEISRLLDVTADVTFLNNMTGTFNVVALLLEDSIVNWQLDYLASPNSIENYMHRHVLRSSISSTWGDQIAQGNMSSGATSSNNYSITLNNTWVEGKCSVVVYVYDVGSSEVIQAEVFKVM
ncbi:MAG: hypothetical protein COB85_05280 [Bacteroidetes bacterium]|nr:MAG: hypothetical protein COB85_05280 [Bacteroidota bacterium]